MKSSPDQPTDELTALRAVVAALPQCYDCRDPHVPATKGSDKHNFCDACVLKYPDGDWYDLGHARALRALRRVTHPVPPLSPATRALLLKKTAVARLDRGHASTESINEALDDAMNGAGVDLPDEQEIRAVYALPELERVGARWALSAIGRAALDG